MEFTTVLTTLITAVSSVFVALITAGYFRKLHDRNVENKSKKLLMVQIQKDELIHFTLREIRRKYNSDRVYILQFHNGGIFYTQSPMQRASVTYERKSDGLERITDRFQNILISNYNWLLKETIEKLQEVLENGKRLRIKYPDCKLLQHIEAVEKELQEYLDREIIK